MALISGRINTKTEGESFPELFNSYIHPGTAIKQRLVPIMEPFLFALWSWCARIATHVSRIDKHQQIQKTRSLSIK